MTDDISNTNEIRCEYEKRPSRAPVNFRAFLPVAGSVFAAVMCGYAYIFSHAAGCCLAVTLFIALAALTAVFFIGYARGKRRLRVAVAMALSLVLSISAFSFAATYINEREAYSDVSGYREIYGRVCAIDTQSGIYRADIGNVTLDGGDVPGLLRVTFDAADNNIAEQLRCGDRIKVSEYVYAYSIETDGRVNGNSYRSDIRYAATVEPERVRFEPGEPTVLERFTDGLRNLLIENMGDKYGNIAFSLVTGDKHTLDSDISDYYSVSGLGHLMAVSGLHIGFMVTLLELLLAKISKRVRFGITMAVLALYCIIADFSPSVVRATIMTVISMSAVFVGGRRDMLSSLLCAFSLILAVRPLYMFEAGFLLSFAAVGGITLFAGSIARVFAKWGVTRKLAEALAACISMQIGITPVMIYFFGSLHVFSILVNSVVIPYVALVFMIIVVLAGVGAIMPFAAGALALPGYMLVPIDYIAQGIAGIPFATVAINATCAVFLCYPVMFCASAFYMLPRGKSAVIAASAAVCIAFCTIGAPRVPLIAVATHGSTRSVVCDGGKTYVIGYVDKEYYVRDALMQLNVNSIDGIYLFALDADCAAAIVRLRKYCDIGAVYCPTRPPAADDVENAGIELLVSADTDDVPAVYRSGDFVGYEYRGVLFAADGVDERAFIGYTVVRARRIKQPIYGVTYLCNSSADSSENVYTANYGMFIYRFA